MPNYQILAKSIKNRKDESMKNGDFFLHKLIENENLLFAALSDGVGSTNCYWVASKIICENTLEHFLNYDFSDKSISSRLLYSIEKANEDILNYSESSCSGMLATLCIAVWDMESNKIYYAYAGDSRIYIYNENEEFIQLTKDQKETIRLTQNGKPVFINGTLATRNMITNAVGQENPVIEVFEKDFKEGESLFMTSDGFYEASDIDSEIPELLKSNDIENDFNSMMEWVRGKNVDDATVLLLRRNDIPDSIDFKDLSEFQQNQIMVDKIINAIKSNDSSSVMNVCGIYEDTTLKLGKDNYIKIMDAWLESDLHKNNDMIAYAYILRLRQKMI